MLWPAGAVRSLPIVGTTSIHMLLAVGRLFNLNSRPLFFYREDAAIPACVEHMWAGRIAPLRPLRTASHLCCIRGNPAPLTGRKREDSGTNPESAGGVPAVALWIFRASAGRLLLTTTVLCRTAVEASARAGLLPETRSGHRPDVTPTAPVWGSFGDGPLRRHGPRGNRASGKVPLPRTTISDLKFAFAGPLGTHRHRCVAGGPFLFALLKFCPPLLCPRL
jgi:hypothetical protein